MLVDGVDVWEKCLDGMGEWMVCFVGDVVDVVGYLGLVFFCGLVDVYRKIFDIFRSFSFIVVMNLRKG